MVISDGVGFDYSLREPKLFKLCSQMRQESKVIYYRNIHFRFRMRHKLEHLYGWLDGIGIAGRVNIRHLLIDISLASSRTCIHEIRRTNSKLSEKATVTYRQRKSLGPAAPYVLSPFWTAGRILKKLHPGAKLLLKIFNNSSEMYMYSLEETVKPFHRGFHYVDLVFLPDQGWFGNPT